MGEREKLSIIIPVYNSEKYLEECIESVINQTYSDWELILVDDGSTDRSVEICERYCCKDSRIKFLTQNHAGASAARKRGIDNSIGEYVAFMDSDDWIDLVAFEKIMAIMCGDDEIDISLFSYSKHKGTSKVDMCQDNAGVLKVYSTTKALEIMFEEKEYTWSLWGKIYKKKLFYYNDFIYAWWPPTYGDDTYVNWNVFKQAGKVALLPIALYHYRINPNSIMHQKVDSGRLIYFDIYDRILKEINDLHSKLAKNIVMAMASGCMNILHELLISGNRDENWYKAYNILKKYVDTYIEELDEQQCAIYELLGMSDSELEKIKRERVNELKSFCEGRELIFIYGAGKLAREVLDIIEKEKIPLRGIVVSNKGNNVVEMDEYSVYDYEYIKERYSSVNVGIITGLGRNNLNQVYPLLDNMTNWDYIDGTKLNLRTV